MKENVLLKIALICSLIGLFVLYFVSVKIDIKDYAPEVLNKIGNDVKLIGTITKISQKENVAFLEVNYQIPITVVLFKENRNLSLKVNDSVEVLGEVQEYKGKEEIIAQKIRIIK